MRRRFAQRARLLGVWGCLLGLLALAGCDSSSDPTTSSPTSTSASPSASSTSASPSSASSGSTSVAYVPVKPEFPAAAKKQTLKSAEVFVKYFYELVNYAFAKPEAGLLGPLGTLDCSACQRYEDRAKKLVVDGERYESAILEFKYVTFSNENVDEPLISYNGVQPGTRILDGSGNQVGGSKKQKVFISLLLKWTANGWRIQSISNA